MQTLGPAIIGLLMGLFVAGGLASSGVGKFAETDILNPRTSTAEAHRMEVETAYQEALSELELDYRQRMQEIALENERLRQEEERARAQARCDNEMMLMWAAFIVGAAALVVLTAAGAYYLIMRARIPYPQATGQ